MFYNAPSGGDGAVRLLGKRTGDDSAEDRVAVDLEALPPDVGTVVILASLDAADGVGFGDVDGLVLDVVDAGGESRVRFDVADAGPETAMVLGELYLRGEEWKFRAVGQGWDSGLAGLATDYGIDVADPSTDFHAPDAPPADHHDEAETRPAEAAVADADASPLNGGPVEPLVVVDVDEVTAQAADADEAEPVAGGPGAVQAAQRRTGVQPPTYVPSD